MLKNGQTQFKNNAAWTFKLILTFKLIIELPEAVFQRCSVKKGVLRNFAKFTGKHLKKCQKETLAQAFSCEFCEISQNTFFHRTRPVAASELRQISLWWKRLRLSCFILGEFNFAIEVIIRLVSGKQISQIVVIKKEKEIQSCIFFKKKKRPKNFRIFSQNIINACPSHLNHYVLALDTQVTLTFSKSTLEILEKDVKYAQINHKNTRKMSMALLWCFYC